jgi:hypothetical protein
MGLESARGEAASRTVGLELMMDERALSRLIRNSTTVPQRTCKWSKYLWQVYEVVHSSYMPNEVDSEDLLSVPPPHFGQLRDLTRSIPMWIGSSVLSERLRQRYRPEKVAFKIPDHRFDRRCAMSVSIEFREFDEEHPRCLTHGVCQCPASQSSQSVQELVRLD